MDNIRIRKSWSVAFTLIVGVCMALVIMLITMDSTSAADKVQISLKDIDSGIQKEIREHPMLALSSNPYDYIKDNEYYEDLISLGVDALPELERTLEKSEENGLNEFIIAIAIEEISQADVKEILDDEFAWDTAKGFKAKWDKVKADAPKSIVQ
jgi:hypothetical protein